MVKRGLGDPYDKVKYLPVKVRGYIDLTKPASSIAVGMGYLLASFLFYYHNGVEGQLLQDMGTIVVVSLSIFLLHSASQALNMAEDAEMDRETPHKQDRPIPSGVVTEDEARTVTWFCSGWGISLAFTVNVPFGIFAMILLFFGIFYNLDPIRAKERIISIPWQAVSRGLFSFPAVWTAYGDPFDPLPWVLGTFMFFYSLGFQNTADFADRELDAKYGIKTFVVEYGIDGTMRIATLSTLFMIITLCVGLVSGLLPIVYSSLFLIIPFCVVMLYYMNEYRDSISVVGSNHICWSLYYVGMVLCVLVPLSSEAMW
jgi:4-hydroxybenzoate polyprenyltransferase